MTLEERKKARILRKKRAKRTSVEVVIIKFVLLIMLANILGI